MIKKTYNHYTHIIVSLITEKSKFENDIIAEITKLLPPNESFHKKMYKEAIAMLLELDIIGVVNDRHFNGKTRYWLKPQTNLSVQSLEKQYPKEYKHLIIALRTAMSNGKIRKPDNVSYGCKK